MTTADPHRMTGAYALHALSAEERAAFERHLATCEPCAQETGELCATAARLALAVPLTPRPALRERVLHRITTVRQEAPGGPVPVRPGRAGPRAHVLSRWALAACLTAAAALGGTTVWQHQHAEDALNQARRAEQGADEIAAVLAVPWQATVGGHTLTVRATDRTGQVQTAHRTRTVPDGADGHHSVVVTVD